VVSFTSWPLYPQYLLDKRMLSKHSLDMVEKRKISIQLHILHLAYAVLFEIVLYINDVIKIIKIILKSHLAFLLSCTVFLLFKV